MQEISRQLRSGCGLHSAPSFDSFDVERPCKRCQKKGSDCIEVEPRKKSGQNAPIQGRSMDVISPTVTMYSRTSVMPSRDGQKEIILTERRSKSPPDSELRPFETEECELLTSSLPSNILTVERWNHIIQTLPLPETDVPQTADINPPSLRVKTPEDIALLQSAFSKR